MISKMAEDYNAMIIKLKENLERLFSLCVNLKKRNLELSEEIIKIKGELDIYKTKTEEIEQKYNNLKSACSLSGISGDNNAAKIKLDKMIREIDNCIALLNR